MALEDHPMWSPPSHHEDLENPSNHVHWVELFYDLIHVVCVFLLGNYLSDHMTVSGFVVFAGMFLSIWIAWGDTTFYNSLYVSTDIYHRLIMSVQICTVMVMAASIPHILGKGWVYFAVAYSINRMITAMMYWRAQKLKDESNTLAHEMFRNFTVLSIVFLVSAFLPNPFNFILFGLSLVALQLSYVLNKVGVMRFVRFTPRQLHLSERFALLFLIVMGEGFFKLVVTLSEKGIYKAGPYILTNFILSGILMFALTWIYFGFVGNGKTRDLNKTTIMKWWYGHMFIMLSAVMIGVAVKAEVKVGFFESYPYKYAVIGCLGLALFLSCIMVIQSAIAKRIEHNVYTKNIQLFGIGMALLTLVLVPFVPAIVGNLMYMIAVYSQIVWTLRRSVRAINNEDAT